MKYVGLVIVAVFVLTMNAYLAMAYVSLPEHGSAQIVRPKRNLNNKK